MTKLKVGDKVRVHATKTLNPWGAVCTGVIAHIVHNGMVAVEVEGNKGFGHSCGMGTSTRLTRNGYWFTLEELTLIK